MSATLRPPPLQGITVLEMGSFVAGPFAGQILGDLGAEVIKIESPGQGDPMRRWGITMQGRSLWWPTLARNKRSVAVDLRTASGREVVRRLALRADVLLENFTPGRMAEWGLADADLRPGNPGIVITHVSGFGQSGPRSAEPGFGSVGEAMGGIRHLTGWPDRPSTRAGVALGDEITAMYAVVGTLAALRERDSSGLGQEVDVALFEAVFSFMESLVADYEIAGRVRGRSGSVLAGVAPSNVYNSADGKEVLIAANGDSPFGRLCAAMGRPELAADERYASHEARGANQSGLDDLIGTWTATLSAADVMRRLSEHAVPHGLIYTAPDMLADDHFRARETIVRMLDPGLGLEVPMPAVVPRLLGSPGRIDSTGPELGQHTRWALTELAGYSMGEVDALLAEGVVAQPEPHEP